MAKADFWKEEIRKAEKPGDAKRLGREFPTAKWNRVRLQVMKDLVRKKFKDPVLRNALIYTGDRELIEGNHWHDNFWGDCDCPPCQKDPRSESSW